jgi:hypothetical protein
VNSPLQSCRTHFDQKLYFNSSSNPVFGYKLRASLHRVVFRYDRLRYFGVSRVLMVQLPWRMLSCRISLWFEVCKIALLLPRRMFGVTRYATVEGQLTALMIGKIRKCR